jgi:hypothetical protein
MKNVIFASTVATMAALLPLGAYGKDKPAPDNWVKKSRSATRQTAIPAAHRGVGMSQVRPRMTRGLDMRPKFTRMQIPASPTLRSFPTSNSGHAEGAPRFGAPL